MRSYKSLIFISKVLKFIAYSNLIVALIIAAFYFMFSSNNYRGDVGPGAAFTYSLIATLGIILLGIISFVFWLAISQLIMLFVNMAEDTFTIATNAYAIAQKSTEKKIDEDEL